MYHYTYLITNLINNKIYYGVRSCECNPEEDTKYMGSGYAMKSAIMKYGIENFKKQVDEIFETRDKANLHEAKIVDEDWVNDKNNYNLRGGGQGGIPSIESRERMRIAQLGKKRSTESIRKMIESNTGQKRSKETREKMSKAQLGKKRNPLSEEHKRKIGQASKGRLKSEETILKQSKEWILESPDGEVMIIINLKKFCREQNLTFPSMIRIANGDRKTHKGWKCKRN